MIINGVDLGALLPDANELYIPPKVEGRVVHIDADFLAYQTTAVAPEKEVTFEDMKHNAGVAIQTLKDMAGATQVHLHTTPSGSNKGDRYDHALLKEYQGNRADKEKPQFLNLMRQHLTTEFPGTAHQFCEADDGMSEMQYEAIKRGETRLSIIASKDKDLCMVPGLHLDWDTGEITDTDNFGRIWIDETKSQKKLKGWGWKFFWAQMLMGDTADNISGIPLIHRDVLRKIKPTQAVAKAENALLVGTEAQQKKAQDFLDNMPHKTCGPILTFDILNRAKDNATAFKIVKGLFKLEPVLYKDYRTNEKITWQQAMLSEMRLLWMRRVKHDPHDVINWLKEYAA